MGKKHEHDMGVSKNRGTPKSSILIGFSIINHPFGVPLFSDTPTWKTVLQVVSGVSVFLSSCTHEQGKVEKGRF